MRNMVRCCEIVHGVLRGPNRNVQPVWLRVLMVNLIRGC